MVNEEVAALWSCDTTQTMMLLTRDTVYENQQDYSFQAFVAWNVERFFFSHNIKVC